MGRVTGKVLDLNYLRDPKFSEARRTDDLCDLNSSNKECRSVHPEDLTSAFRIALNCGLKFIQ
jgi:hypothetical protein